MKSIAVFLTFIFFSGLLFSQSDDLAQRISSLTAEKKYREAIPIQLELIKRDSINSSEMYNLACFY
ncbi:MAG: hypothetical protein ACM3Q2_04090, partial [Syntrophothermus sp.]